MCPPRGTRAEWEAIRRAFMPQELPLSHFIFDVAGQGLPPSDVGIDGAKPLGLDEWTMPGDLVSDAEWSTQNRRINDLLAGRA